MLNELSCSRSDRAQCRLQRSGLMGPGVAEYLASPQSFRTLRAGDVDENSEMADLILKSFRIIFGKTKADQSSGVTAKSGGISGYHQRMKKHLRTDEKSDRRNQHGAETRKPTD